ncbi:aminotransferase [Streptococcus parauberis]|uniref:aminotransferase n=1 Tax=Streptococcus parauberis TaxID=1348 RepID=UPI000E308ABA|nr:aminotransferase [Streptococcus parauberis]RFE01932.1 Capreomycidine synthase [Streptococcus parauberis]
MQLPIFGVEEWLNENEKLAKYDIASVSISSLSLNELFDITGTNRSQFYQTLAKTTLDYGWIEGSPQFKQAVANLYRNQTASNILQSNGATGANLTVLFTLVEPGDQIIAHYPSYQQLYDLPRSMGASIDYWHIKEENNWLPDLEELRNLVGPKTKLITINNANNPTGAYMDRDYLLELVEIARSCGAYLLSDEVYHSFESNQLLGIVDLYDKGISVNSLSKTFSLPGLRIGWIAAAESICQKIKNYRDYTMICAGVFDDKVASLALSHSDKILKRNEQIVSENLAILQEWVTQEDKASMIAPKKVSTAFVKLDIEGPIENFCRYLLNEYETLVVPGNRFARESYVRIGYTCKKETLIAGLQCLSLALNKYQANNKK